MLAMWVIETLLDCAGVSVSADTQKTLAGSETGNKQKMAGREQGRVCEHLFKYLNLLTSWKKKKHLWCQRIKTSHVVA